MDSLYLLQFGCFLFMLINAAYLVLGSLHTQWQNKRYEHSRNLIVVALAILAFQYYLQMSLGLRATDDAYGALLNVLVYPLSFSLIQMYRNFSILENQDVQDDNAVRRIAINPLYAISNLCK